MKKILWILVSLFFIGWAFEEQPKENARVWVQIVGVVVLILNVMLLMRRVPSNSQTGKTHQEESEEEEQKEN